MKSKDERVKLPPMDARTRLATSFAFTGVSLEGHLTATRRDAFTRAGGQPIRELPHLKYSQTVKIGGLIVARRERGALVRDGEGFLLSGGGRSRRHGERRRPTGCVFSMPPGDS